jgi:hypothetical protein
MKKILIILFILLYHNIQSQEYKQPTQYYYQSETNKDISYLALIGGNIALITIGNLIDQRMSGLTPNKNQHTNLIISIIICGGIDYLYLNSKFRNRKSNNRKKKKENEEQLIRSKF